MLGNARLNRTILWIVFFFSVFLESSVVHAKELQLFHQTDTATGKANLQLNTSQLKMAKVGDLIIFNEPGIPTAKFVLDRIDPGQGDDINFLGRSSDDQWPARMFVLAFADKHVNAILDLQDGSRVTVSGPSENLRIDRRPTHDSARFRPKNDGIGLVRKVGEIRVPADLNPPVYGGMATIDVVVATSPEFEKDYYKDGVLARIHSLLNVANSAFLSSGIAIELKLVGFTTVAADAKKSSEQMLYDITGKDTKLTKTFSVLRETKNADIVIYLRKYLPVHLKVCGTAYVAGKRKSSSEVPIDLSGESAAGFAVVQVDLPKVKPTDPDPRCFEETLAHEVGHNLGSMHDHVEDWSDERGAYNENFAHIGYGAEGGFTTIMGYTNEDHPRLVPYFSAPNLLCDGVPCGREDGDLVADNARRFNDVRFKVAGWRGPKYSELLVEIAGSGDGQITAQGLDCGYICRAQYPSDRYAELHAIPVAGSTFAGWSVPCSPQPAAPPTTCFVSMSETRNVTASFISKEPYARLTVQAPDRTMGLIKGNKINCGTRCSARFKTATDITIEAIPKAGKKFDAWTGACAGQKSTCVLRLSSDVVVGAKFIGRKVVSLAAANRTSYAVLDDGSLWAWGDNSAGQFGNGTVSEGSPRPIHVGDGYQTVTAGAGFAFGRTPNGDLFAWGRNNSGQLGDGTEQQRLSPVKVGSDFSIVSAGEEYVLAVKTNGDAWTWGFNLRGQLGNGSQVSHKAPTAIGKRFSAVSAHDSTSFGVMSDGTLWGWGENRMSQLGAGSDAPFHTSPVQIATNILKVQGGAGRSVAINTDHVLLGWGDNYGGQLDNGNTSPPMLNGTVRRPVAMGQGYSFATVAAIGLGSAIRENGRWEMWGPGLADSTPPTPSRPPTQFSGHFSSTVCGTDFCLAQTSSGSVWAIGRNYYGQLGNGSKEDQWKPVQVFLAD